MRRTERILKLAASVATAVVLSGASAWAISGGAGGNPHKAAADTSTTAPCQPGFGTGDDNHCHSGPPGQESTTSTSSTSSSTTVDSTTSTSSTSTSTTSTTTTSIEPSSTTSTSVPCKPGWGYGDKNHCHSGPPGLMKKHHADDGS